MPPKRKATTATSSRPAKRVASGISTPVSLGSSESDNDAFSELASESDLSGTETSNGRSRDSRKTTAGARGGGVIIEGKDLQKAMAKFDPRNYNSAASARGKQQAAHDVASMLFKPGRDMSNLELKPDHASRPLWLDPERGRLVLETFSPAFTRAQNFLINIAEPQSRTSHIHEYTITGNSLFAAVSVGLSTHDIIRQLETFSKTKLPEGLKEFVISATSSFGKVRLVLKQNQYFIESQDPSILQSLLRDPVIGPARIQEEGERGFTQTAAPKLAGLVIPGTKEAAGQREVPGTQQRPQPTPQTQGQDLDGSDDEYGNPTAEEEQNMVDLLREDDEEDEEGDRVHAFQITADKIEAVQKQCVDIGLPLTSEYDFRADDRNASLDIDLRPSAQIRYYQEHALSKMFGNGRARSGIIVLPCGAGKTLVGITAACTVKKSAIVLCTSAMSVVQWKQEFLKWSNVDPNDIAVFTSSEKERLPQRAGIVICTYSMVSSSHGKRAHDSQVTMDFITSREWGLMVLDEVHVVPAEMFRRVTSRILAHTKLGLTATLLREDDKIKDLNFLIGPKLYEANWLQLSNEGHIARVQCAEVWCPMSAEFYAEYLETPSPNKRSLLSTMNPRKFQACQYLIDFHEKRGDKIIIFSDNVYALKAYALKLVRPYIYGDTPQRERENVLANFQQNPAVSTILLSKIGDTSLDLPEATVLIQISSHYGSRRQEAQRLGRILRAKRRGDEGFNAFFYSLVSKDTNEMYYSSKRQAFLVDQGYSFKVITHLTGMEKMPGLNFTTTDQRDELLQAVLLQNETAGEVENIKEDLFSGRQMSKGKKKPGVKRTAGTLSELAGGEGMAYIEYNKSKNKDLRKNQGPQSAFFKKTKRELERKRQAAKDLT
ncbi:DNA repair helicase RAD25 [Elasticomyces elasticus]|nr:DNA repair helicase RAD25 [Elasticomyces elasticus]KAK5001081.1 DNA repair helicase RAD25 [Elasticomyces elasticus]